MRAQVSGPLLLVLAFAWAVVSPVFAFPPPSFQQPNATKSSDYDTYSDTNNVLMLVTNRGWIGHDPRGLLGRPSGLYFPRGGNKTLLYSAGLWMGCRMGKEYRASIAEYDADFTPGPVVNGTFATDNEKSRVYKISRNDSRASNEDYANWPFDQGAPALQKRFGGDSLAFGGLRIPRIMGDQTFWSVFNDLNPANHRDPGSTLPLGAEVQLLAWSDEWSGSLGRTVFLNYTIINKSDSDWHDARFGLWADPDIGRPGDDLAGCDSALGLGYCYNNGPDLLYGDAPPAIGFVILSGPAISSEGDSVWSVDRARWIRDHRALNMGEFSAWGNGGDPSGESSVYCVLSGQDRTGQLQVDPTNNAPTSFFYSGDPVGNTGWLDRGPADRRFILGVGPLTVGRADTIEILAAVVVGQGDDAIGSVKSLKQAAETAHSLARGRFASATPSVVDILPGSCPNVVSFEEPIDLDFDFIRPATTIPTASIVIGVYSTPGFDATTADPREVYLNGVAPSGWTVDDVGSPDVRETPCGCGRNSRDGLVDLLLSYDRDKIGQAMQPLLEGAVRTLELRTIGRDGTRGIGHDCLTFVDLIKATGANPLSAGADDDLTKLPFSLSNQPNPFNAATMINYRIATDGPVRVEVYDILGRRMATLVDAWQRAGEYQVMWNGVDVHGGAAGSGMYFYRLQSDDGLLTRKMILLK